MSFLDVQDLATFAAQSRFFSLLAAAWDDLSGCQTLMDVLDLSVASGLAGWMVRLKRRP